MDTHYNIHARACGCAYRCVYGKRNGKGMGGNGKGSGLRQRQETSGPFLKRPASFWRTASSFSGRTRTSGPERKGYTTTYPENSVHTRKPHTKHLQQSFAKLLPLLPPNPLKPRWTGPLKGWWHHLFLCGKKGCCHHFHLFFTPERPVEGEDTGGGGGPNTGKRRRVRTDRTTVAYRQNHSNNSVELWLHLHGTKVTILMKL